MSEPQFHIHNRESLQGERSLLPLARYLSRLLTSSGFVKEISLEANPPEYGWLIFVGEGERGFGVRYEDGTSSRSPLQRSLDLVKQASAVVRGFGGTRAFPFTLSLRATPPESWRVCKVMGVVSAVWCGSSLPVLDPPTRALEEPRDPITRIRLFGFLSTIGKGTEGERIPVEDVVLELPEVGIVGRGCVRGGHMTMEIVERGDLLEQRIPGVRLDLGEIEMRLSDLVSLRPGSVLDLGSSIPERCALRIGSTTLAQGRFTMSDGKFTLTVEAVV
ncbi:MAG: Type flagellar switch regulator (C-ring) FliN C-term [Pseudomonadota bacterium]